MKFLPDNSYHVYNQGNNHERLLSVKTAIIIISGTFTNL